MVVLQLRAGSERPAAARAPTPAAVDQFLELADLWRYWQSKLNGRPVLPRAEFAPFEIPALLPILTLIERAADRRLRYRLVGSRVVETYGFEATGKFLDEIMSPARVAIANAHVDAVLKSARPAFSQNEYASPSGILLVNSRLLLPLSDASGGVTLVLAGNVIRSRVDITALFGDEELAPRRDIFELL